MDSVGNFNRAVSVVGKWILDSNNKKVLPTGSSPRCPLQSHPMNFGLFYGTFYLEVGNFSGPKLEGKIPLLDIFVEEKKGKFSLEMGFF